MPATSVAVLRINARSHITLSGLGSDGNWGNTLTEVAAASDGVALPTGTIQVKSTAGFPVAGTIQVMTSVGVTKTVHHTRITATTLTRAGAGWTVGQWQGRFVRIGAMYQQLDPGSVSALWVKQAADGENTGWVEVTKLDELP